MSSRRLIEKDRITFPENLNAALFTNIRYQVSNGDYPLPSNNAARNSNNGEWIIPAETLELAYVWADDGAATDSKDYALTAGITYLPWYNVRLSLLETW
jgi:hypothetical protein